MPAVVDREQCRACGTCVEVCERGAIHVDQVAFVDAARCVECGACVDACPNGAITVVLEPGSEVRADRGESAPATVVKTEYPSSSAADQPPQPQAEPAAPQPTGESFLSSLVRIAERVANALTAQSSSTPTTYESGRPSSSRSPGSVSRPSRGGGSGRRRRHRGGRGSRRG